MDLLDTSAKHCLNYESSVIHNMLTGLVQAIDGALSFSVVFSHDAYLPQCMLLWQKMPSLALPVPTKDMMASYYLNKPNIHALIRFIIIT